MIAGAPGTRPPQWRPATGSPNGVNPFLSVFRRLADEYGPQHWWPGETPFEVMVGAILTQNTNWSNVERAIRNLKEADLLLPERLIALPDGDLAHLIRPSGYFNVKARRLKEFVGYLRERYDGRIQQMRSQDGSRLRRELLAVRGIGPETADSILLYALGFRVFVVDAYTRRVFSRHGIFPDDAGYDEMQQAFMTNLPEDVSLYNEYHALIVRVGKDHCRPRRPACHTCPLGTDMEPPT